jgi:hypothetical protein
MAVLAGRWGNDRAVGIVGGVVDPQVGCYQFEDYYRPCRVRALLRLLPYLQESRPPTDPEMQQVANRVFGPGGWREEATAKFADLDGAIGKLMAIDVEMAEAVEAFAFREPQRTTAQRMGISTPTVRVRRDEGIWMIARILGYEEQCCGVEGMTCPERGGIL